LETTEVRSVDLIERGVSRRAEIACPSAPFAIGGAALCDGRQGQQNGENKYDRRSWELHLAGILAAKAARRERHLFCRVSSRKLR